jgi:hypothetical protein
MRIAATSLVIAVLLWGASAPFSHAQKGTGEAAGVARQPARPEVVSLSGKVRAIETGPCEMGTGRAYIGTHLVLETPQGKELNVHLGPAAAVGDVVGQLPPGKKVTVKGFRTGRMSESHYVAQSLAFDDTSIQLRDETLRPFWAGRGAVSGGRSAPQWGPGRGQGRAWGPRPGYGRGWGRGWGGRRAAGYRPYRQRF